MCPARGGQVLEVVEEEKGARARERLGDALEDGPAVGVAHAKHVGDRGRDELGIGHGGEADEVHRSLDGAQRGDLERKPALARAAGPGDRDEPHVRARQQRPASRSGPRAGRRGDGGAPGAPSRRACAAARTPPAARRRRVGRAARSRGRPSAGGSPAGGTRARDRRRRRRRGSTLRRRSDRRGRRRRSWKRRRRPSRRSPPLRGRARPYGSRSVGARRRPAATARSPARVASRRREHGVPRAGKGEEDAVTGPVDLLPSWVEAAPRTSSRRRARTGAKPPRSEFRSRVEPSMSAKSRVTVPLGRRLRRSSQLATSERVYEALSRAVDAGLVGGAVARRPRFRE